MFREKMTYFYTAQELKKKPKEIVESTLNWKEVKPQHDKICVMKEK